MTYSILHTYHDFEILIEFRSHICQKMTFHGNYHHEKQFVEISMKSELEHKTKAFICLGTK